MLSAEGISETRFAKSGDVHIAYKIVGEGPVDVIFVAGMEYQTVEALEFPPLMDEAVAFFSQVRPLIRLIRFDKRGTGSSDRVVGVPSLEERMDDVRAVMDAAGSEAAVLFGQVDGAAMSCLLLPIQSGQSRSCCGKRGRGSCGRRIFRGRRLVTSTSVRLPRKSKAGSAAARSR